MVGMVAIDNLVSPGRVAGKFHGRFDGLGARIGKEHLVQIWNVLEQTLGQNTGESGDVHLHQIGHVGVEHALQRIAQYRVVAA